METQQPLLKGETGTLTPSHPTKANTRMDQHIDDLVGVFTDPIIVWPSPWQDTLPEWIKPAITMDRLIENMKALKGEKLTATDAEVLAYMYPRTMEAALDRDWVDIYLYVATRVMSRHKEAEIPADIKVDSLRDDQMRDLQHLKDWIYQHRLKVRAERRRAEKAEARAEAEAKAPVQLGLGV